MNAAVRVGLLGRWGKNLCSKGVLSMYLGPGA
jgi:hypothetical protein